MTDLSWRSVCDGAPPDLAPGETFIRPDPLHDRSWTDEYGVTWRRRGLDNLKPKQTRRILARPVLVMHLYHGYPHEHAGPHLSGLVTEIESVWAGDDDNGMHTFDIAEFRDDDRRIMVMIVEAC